MDIKMSEKLAMPNPSGSGNLSLNTATPLRSVVFRHEHKYLINRHDYLTLSGRLKHFMCRDRYAGAKGDYHIRSLYFDDFIDTALYEKQIGTLSRKKYRIRIYNLQSDVIKLEKKSRVGQFIHKQTLPLLKEHVDLISRSDFSFLKGLDDPLAREFYLDLNLKGYRPKVIVDYVREAFTLPYNNVRITFDKYLSTGLESTNLFDAKLPVIAAIDEPLDILEVKYTGFLPDYIKDLMRGYPCQRLAISKYTYCRKFTKTHSWEDQ
ncbi:polyphosphate polymerase domain-containing protein [Akkermansiaceae bacterium]|nr:polyphosphate polymerase domain-containing protein [Akkermansiaceae bacterium]